MIDRLTIRDFAIIDELSVELRDGFTVLTGETGAGKSILVHAVHLLLGGRPSQDMIRTDRDTAEVEVEIRLDSDSPIYARLNELDLLDGENLNIRRVISRSGRHRAYINARAIPVATLAEFSRGLVDISGQHEHVELNDEKTHRLILDEFGNLGDMCLLVKNEVGRLRVVEQQIEDLSTKQTQREERKEYLEFSLARIDEVDPKPDELEQLQQDLVRLRGSDRLEAGIRKVIQLIYEQEGSALDLLGVSSSELSGLIKIDPLLANCHEQLHSITRQIEDLAGDLRSMHEGIEIDPARLEQMEERLAVLKGLVRVHGKDLQAVLEKQDQMRQEMSSLEELTGAREQLEIKAREALDAAMALAKDLSHQRRRVAGELTESLTRELHSLGMQGARVEVEVMTAGSEGLGETGLDNIRLLLSANPGEEVRPLAKVASGGELSRVFLALKKVLLEVDRVPTYIFDEVDSGVGGEVAKIIGEKLSAVSSRHQVICITHLPQIAALADRHYVVKKKVVEGRTITEIRRLDEDQRIEELTRMAGGESVGEKAKGYVRELRKHARQGQG